MKTLDISLIRREMNQPDRDHYKLTGHGEQFAADISILDGNPHARIIGEIANTQSITALNTKCEAWMHKTYVRCVLGIKLFPKQAIRGSCSSGNVG
ncbi:unnamed protein product [Rhizophagus irregularis]|nr:unnamed protein product [Rhizophagus irregularis]